MRRIISWAVAAMISCVAIGPSLSAEGGADSWTIVRSASRMTDAPGVSAYTLEVDRQSDRRELLAICSEGQTSLVVVVGSFLLKDLNSDRVRVMYRIDRAPPVSASWGTSVSGTAAGLWGRSAIDLLRQLESAETVLIRVVERNNRSHEMLFRLAGLQAVNKELATACRWPAPSATPQRSQAPTNPGAPRAQPPSGLDRTPLLASGRAFLRARPSEDSELLQVLMPGQMLLPLAPPLNGWIRVALQDGRDGFVLVASTSRSR